MDRYELYFNEIEGCLVFGVVGKYIHTDPKTYLLAEPFLTQYNTLKTKLEAAEVRTEVYEWIDQERRYQDAKWGSLEEKQQTIEGYLLILRKELEEAEMGWMKNLEGRSHVLSEIIQMAAVAVACLEQHGKSENSE